MTNNAFMLLNLITLKLSIQLSQHYYKSLCLAAMAPLKSRIDLYADTGYRGCFRDPRFNCIQVLFAPSPQKGVLNSERLGILLTYTSLKFIFYENIN